MLETSYLIDGSFGWQLVYQSYECRELVLSWVPLDLSTGPDFARSEHRTGFCQIRAQGRILPDPGLNLRPGYVTFCVCIYMDD